MIKKIILFKYFKKYYLVLVFSLGIYSYLFLSSNLVLLKNLSIFITFTIFLLCFKYKKTNLYHIFFQLIVLFLSIFEIYQEINITILSTVFIFIFLYYLISGSSLKIKLFYLLDSVNVYFILLFIFLTNLILQSFYLDIETIDWDVHSYLVTSLEIGRGNLPYENQWEDKQPVFFYLYYLFIELSQGSLVYFRLLNDIYLFLCAVVIFQISKHLSHNNHLSAFLSALIFISLMSIPWGTAEYSELYAVLFLGLSFYLLLGKSTTFLSLFFSGICFSVATLINIGTLLFAVGYLIQIYFISRNLFVKNIINFSLGFVSIHMIFFLLYFLNDLLDIYIATLITIPFGYGSNISINLNSFNSFLKSFFEYNIFLYLILITAIFVKIYKIFNEFYDDRKFKVEDNIVFIFIGISATFFLIAAKGFNHHLIFFIFFISIISIKFNFHKVAIIFFLLLPSFIIYQLTTDSQNTDLAFQENIGRPGYASIVSNLSNLNNLENSYPLKKLSNEIDGYFEDDYSILAFDSNLILFYLDKPNFSYIIHPTNHFENWIVDRLYNLNRISKNNIINMIDQKPDVIICSNTSIAKDSSNYQYFNCEVSDYYPEYKKLETIMYERDILIEYYFDRYKDISVFLKTNE